MSRDPLEEQEYEAQEREDKARESFRTAKLEESASVFEEAAARSRQIVAERRAHMQEQYGSIAPEPHETLTEYQNRMQKTLNDLMAVAHPGAIYYVRNGGLSTEPEPEKITAHKRISLIKSGLRIFGYFVGILALPFNVAMVSAFAILVISEVLGIVEENHESD